MVRLLDNPNDAFSLNIKIMEHKGFNMPTLAHSLTTDDENPLSGIMRDDVMMGRWEIGNKRNGVPCYIYI